MKEFLSQKGVPFRERDVSVDPSARQEAYRVSGQTGIPVVLVNGEVVVGFDRPRLESLLATSSSAGTRRPFGMRITDASRMSRITSGVPVSGAYIDRVTPGSPADRAGLSAGDIVTEVNERSVAQAEDLEKALASVRPGTRLTLVFVRNNQRQRTEAMM